MEWTAWAASLLALALAGCGAAIWGRWAGERAACRVALRSLAQVMYLYAALLDPDRSCDVAPLPIKGWEQALPFFGSLPAGTRSEVERAYVALALYNREVHTIASRDLSRSGKHPVPRDDHRARMRADAAYWALRRASAALGAPLGPESNRCPSSRQRPRRCRCKPGVGGMAVYVGRLYSPGRSNCATPERRYPDRV